MKPLYLFSFLSLFSPLHSQVVGAIETFTYAENADSWNLYDYSTGEVTAPLWTLPGSDDPEIYASFVNDSPVSLFASEISSDQYLIGDYATAGVAGIFCNVYVEGPANFDALEFYFVSGDTFYYSDYYFVTNAGWSTLEESLKDGEWYIYDETSGEYFLVPITDTILSDVVEIGLNFYPLPGAPSDGEIVGIDNFTLLADITPTEPVVSKDGGSLSFQTVPGIQYTIEQNLTLKPNEWEFSPIEPFESTGLFTYFFTPPAKLFFQIKQEALYFEIPQAAPL